MVPGAGAPPEARVATAHRRSPQEGVHRSQRGHVGPHGRTARHPSAGLGRGYAPRGLAPGSPGPSRPGMEPGAPGNDFPQQRPGRLLRREVGPAPGPRRASLPPLPHVRCRAGQPYHGDLPGPGRGGAPGGRPVVEGQLAPPPPQLPERGAGPHPRGGRAAGRGPGPAQRPPAGGLRPLPGGGGVGGGLRQGPKGRRPPPLGARLRRGATHLALLRPT